MNHRFQNERPALLLVLATLGLMGCVSLAAGTMIAPWFVPDYDWVSDTISDLAAGSDEILMDVALYGFAAGLLAVSIAAAHAHLGKTGWSIGTMSFAVLSVLVVIVAARNEYGDGDQGGIVIHSYLVYGLGALFLGGPLSMTAGLRSAHPGARRIIIGLAVVWALTAPLFFFMPTGIDGIYERGLGVVACGIVLTLSYVFYARARDIP